MDRVGYKPRDDVEYARDAALGVIRRQFEFRECFGKKGKGFQATVEDFNEFKRERSLMMVLPEGEEWVHDWAGIRYEPDSALKDLWYMFHPHILFDPSVDYRQWADNLQKLDRMRIWASMYRGSGQDALGVYWDQHVRAHKPHTAPGALSRESKKRAPITGAFCNRAAAPFASVAERS